MKKSLFPLLNRFSSFTYINAFICGAIISTLTAVFAVYFNSLTKERLAKTDFCNSRYNLFCAINLNKYSNIFNLCIKTFTATITISVALFFIFGWGGGSLNIFYEPKSADFLGCILLLYFVFFINFVFFFTIILKVYKKLKLESYPSIRSVIYAILFSYGFKSHFHYTEDGLKSKNKEFQKNWEMREKIISMKDRDKINYLDKQKLKYKIRILHLLPPKERAKIFNVVDEKKTILYLSLLSPKEKAETIAYMN
tara:strand:- start:190 stop:948 length:759 start_codon:yes stop_codon:yes gene_type:complete